MGRVAASLCLVIALTSCNGDTTAMERVAGPPLPPVAHNVTVSAASPPTLAPIPDVANVWEGFSATSPEALELAGLTRGEVDVYETPGSSEPMRTLPATTILGTATVVLAANQPTSDGWLEVMLPGRPNGSTGWIEITQLDLFVVSDRIVIDLSERELVYYSNDEETLRSPVAIGTDGNPTPTGLFFVTDSVRIENGGPWGPAALGLSARSDTITEFNGGDGIIGIHGTNKPGSIGKAASLGCIRLPNEVITELRSLVSLGTPVEIKA